MTLSENTPNSPKFVVVKNGDGTVVYLDRGYVFTARPAGMYTLYANDESECPVELKIMVKNKC